LSVIENILKEGKEKGLSTTSEICYNVIKPQTEANKCALVDQIPDGNDDKLVAPATCFVSHAWSYNLEDSVDVMRQFEEEHPRTYFWFDLVINNQHDTSERPFEWWCNTFQESIEKIGTVVLVLAPWDNPTPLKRSWCLFEIMCSMNAGEKVDLKIRLPTHQEDAFIKGLEEDHKSAINALIGVKTEESEAFSESDKKNIFKAVEESIGFHNLNSKINDQMRLWFVEEGQKGVKKIEESEEDVSENVDFANLCGQLGNMLWGLGELKKALEYYEKALNICQKVLGDDHPQTKRNPQ